MEVIKEIHLNQNSTKVQEQHNITSPIKGGGGSGQTPAPSPTAMSLESLTNVEIDNPTQGQDLEFDATSRKWKNKTPSGGGGSDGFPPLIYSDEEREVGVWKDGKPLYQKTINVPSSAITENETTISHGISNVDTIYFADGCMVRGGNLTLPLVTYHTVNSWASSIFNLTRTNFTLYLGNDELSRVLNVYVTLLYTKTTDVAGSGRYTTYGGLTHHYSTTEQVVGTWIDGKPIYELVIDYDNTSGLNSGSTTIATIATGLNIIPGGIKAILYNNSDGRQYILPYAKTDGGSQITYNKTSGAVIFLGHNDSWGSNWNKLYIALQYTKTTD